MEKGLIKPKRICVIITGPPLGVFSGGIQTHVNNFLKAFKHSEGITIKHFLTTLALYNKESLFFKIFRISFLILKFPKEILNTDVVHINSTLDTRSIIRDSVFLILSKLMRKRVVLQFHGGLASEIILFRFYLARVIFIKFLNFAGIVLFLSKEQQKDFSSVFKSFNSRVVSNYIDLNVECKSKSNEYPVFLFLSRLDEEKGLKEIIQASEFMANNGNKFLINICGDGPLREWLNQEIVEKNLSEHINYLGMVIGNKKHEILNESDVMLLPTKHKEGFPYAILEAFKYSMPVISCPIGAVSEIIKNGWNGFIIKPSNTDELVEAMEYFCKNPSEIMTMGKRSRLLAEQRFSIDEMKRIFLEVYLSTLR